MALMHELNPKDTKTSLSEESKGLPWGELIRDYEPLPDAKWRFGRPNYARVNKHYFEHRWKAHAEGSLEAVVQRIVKNWEVESHHLGDIRQWKTMDVSKFWAAVNGGAPADAQLMCDVGPYNMLIGDVPEYTASQHTFESANTRWSNVFTQGFAFEVLEVMSGPPAVTFRWRHFGQFTGDYMDPRGKKLKGDGQIVDLIGMCIARVNEQLIIESLDVYYNPDDLLKALVSRGVAEEGPVPKLDLRIGQPRTRDADEGSAGIIDSMIQMSPRWVKTLAGSACYCGLSGR